MKENFNYKLKILKFKIGLFKKKKPSDLKLTYQKFMTKSINLLVYCQKVSIFWFKYSKVLKIKGEIEWKTKWLTENSDTSFYWMVHIAGCHLSSIHDFSFLFFWLSLTLYSEPTKIATGMNCLLLLNVLSKWIFIKACASFWKNCIQWEVK